MRTASRVTSGPIPSPAPTRIFNFICYLPPISDLQLRFWNHHSAGAMVIREQGDKVLVEDRFSAICQLIEAVINHVQIGGIEAKPSSLRRCAKARRPECLPSTMR